MNDETPETGKLTICGERREGGFGAERPIRRLEGILKGVKWRDLT